MKIFQNIAEIARLLLYYKSWQYIKTIYNFFYQTYCKKSYSKCLDAATDKSYYLKPHHIKYIRIENN